MDPRIRIQTKIPWIRNTDRRDSERRRQRLGAVTEPVSVSIIDYVNPEPPCKGYDDTRYSLVSHR